MNGKAKKSVANAISMVMALYCGAASADGLIKRAKCTTAAEGLGTGVYLNGTTPTRAVTVQIVRDGCRPKNGGYHLLETNLDGDINYGGGIEMPRVDRNTWAVQRNVRSLGVARINFVPSPIDSRVSGTFDYVLKIE